MDIKFKLNFDKNHAAAKVLENNNFWLEAATEWWRLSRKYIPMKTGALSESVNLSPKTIEYYADYANYIYNGELYTDKNGRTWVRENEKKPINTHRPLRFNREHHDRATSRWDEAAREEQYPKLIETMQNYVDKGALNLHE